MCTRFFWLHPRPIAFHWENGEIRCGLWGITQRQGEIRCGLWGIIQKKVWVAGSPLSERWNKVQAFEESLKRRCGLQADHWASVDSDHLHCMSCCRKCHIGKDCITSWTELNTDNGEISLSSARAGVFWAGVPKNLFFSPFLLSLHPLAAALWLGLFFLSFLRVEYPSITGISGWRAPG